MSGSASIALDRVAVVAGRTPILREVSLEVSSGSRAAVLGHSGSGKTTLLRAVAGLQEIRAGEIRLGGVVASAARERRLAPHERGVALVFQDLALWPHLDVASHLRFVLGGRGLARGEVDARVDAMIDAVGLGERRRARPGTLSGGERQRLALARALVVRPPRVLLDEPFSSLDLPLRRELIELVLRLQGEQGFALLHVTHDPLEAAILAEEIYVLETGQVAWHGSPEALLAGDAAATRPLAEALRWLTKPTSGDESAGPGAESAPEPE